MWRPDNWHSPYEEYTMDEPGMKMQHESFEAGADAILEALKVKEDTVRLKSDSTSRIPAYGNYPEIIVEGKPYDEGWLVHIPEEGK